MLDLARCVDAVLRCIARSPLPPDLLEARCVERRRPVGTRQLKLSAGWRGNDSQTKRGAETHDVLPTFEAARRNYEQHVQEWQRPVRLQASRAIFLPKQTKFFQSQLDGNGDPIRTNAEAFGHRGSALNDKIFYFRLAENLGACEVAVIVARSSCSGATSSSLSGTSKIWASALMVAERGMTPRRSQFQTLSLVTLSRQANPTCERLCCLRSSLTRVPKPSSGIGTS